MDYKLVTSCRICKSKNLHKYLDLAQVSLANSLLDSPEQVSHTYPIQVLFCEDCYLSQLSIVVDPSIMFDEYYYHSSVSQTFKTHCLDMAKTLKPRCRPNPSMIDIAANDGCLMEQFRNEGFVVRGFDPCKKMAKEAWENKKLLIIPHFWTKQEAHNARSWSGEDIITATNVFAHVDDLHGFLEGVKYHFENNPKGIFVAEFPYFNNLLENNQFDTIYHEHLSYFLLGPLTRLFKECGIPIFRVEEHHVHGGSLRIYASMYDYPIESFISDKIHFEESHNLYKLDTYKKFSERVDKIKNDLTMCLEILYHSNNKVMCYGASAKGISLFNYCKIPSKFIHSIVDDTPEKQGKFTPGTHIPIVDYSRFELEKPSHILLTAWNFEAELCAKTKFHKDRGGYYIIPIPEVRVV